MILLLRTGTALLLRWMADLLDPPSLPPSGTAVVTGLPTGPSWTSAGPSRTTLRWRSTVPFVPHR